MTEDEARSAYYTAIDAVSTWKSGPTIEGALRGLLILLLMKDVISGEEVLDLLKQCCQDYA